MSGWSLMAPTLTTLMLDELSDSFALLCAAEGKAHFVSALKESGLDNPIVFARDPGVAALQGRADWPTAADGDAFAAANVLCARLSEAAGSGLSRDPDFPDADSDELDAQIIEPVNVVMANLDEIKRTSSTHASCAPGTTRIAIKPRAAPPPSSMPTRLRKSVPNVAIGPSWTRASSS